MGRSATSRSTTARSTACPTGSIRWHPDGARGQRDARELSARLRADRQHKKAGRNTGSVTLGPVPGVPNGAITGSATLAQANGSLVVTVKASGLTPGATNATALDLGSCQYQSYVLYDLPPMTADSSGNGSVTMTINNAEALSA